MMIGNVRSRTLVDDPANMTPSYNATHTLTIPSIDENHEHLPRPSICYGEVSSG